MLEVAPDLEAGTTSLILSNWRGFGDTIGFPTSDTPTFPASLGGGSAETWSDGWSDAQVDYYFNNFMAITDDNELASATDARSFRAGVVQ